MSSTSAEPVVSDTARVLGIRSPRRAAPPARGEDPRGFGARAALLGPPLGVLVVLLGIWYAISLTL